MKVTLRQLGISVWAVWSFVVCILGVTIVRTSWAHDYFPRVIATLLVASSIAGLIILLQPTTRWRLIVGFALSCLGAFGRSICMLVLPWEDPYTGEGSPLAVLIGLVIDVALVFVLVCAPGAALVFWNIVKLRAGTQGTKTPSPPNPPARLDQTTQAVSRK